MNRSLEIEKLCKKFDLTCQILNQNEIEDETITNKLGNIIDNKDEYLSKKLNMKNFSYQNTWNNINQKITSVINEN